MLIVRIDPGRLTDPEIASEGERERLKALAERFSREDLLRSFDLLTRAESDIRYSSQPRHQFEMTLVKWIHLRQLTPLSDLIAQAGTAPGTQHRAPGTQRQAVGPQQQAPARSTEHSAPSTARGAPAPSTEHSAPSTAHRAPAPSTEHGAPSTDVRGALLGAIREQNKVFYGMVVAQAQKVSVAGEVVTFTFAPVHKALRAQLETKRAWIQELARAVTGRRMAVEIREADAAPEPKREPTDRESARKAELKARAKKEPSVQAVLDVFGGEIEDVEEVD
jgi:DNA polymerase-3 subunit gamma/tau